MSKLRKSILIIGILVIAVAASLATALALYATGSMKTDPIKLVYILHDREKIYDGTPLQLDDALNDITLKQGKLAAGHTAKIEFSGSQTNVGTSESDATIKIYDKNGFNVTDDYSIKVVAANLTVYQKSISVELPSQKVVYNGSKVLFTEYKTEGELVAGHRIYGSTEAAVLNVGDTLPDDLTPLIFDVAGNDVTKNYDIDFNLGDIEIEVIPRPVSVCPVSYEKVYDGKEIVANEITFVEGSLVEGQYVEYEINYGYENALTGVGEIETSVTSLKIYDTINGEKVEVTQNYDVSTHETGTLKVTPRPLTVAAKSASFTYTGEEQSLKYETEALSVEGLADGEELISVAYFGGQTDVGVSENVIREITLNCSGDNYEITLIDGKIEVTPFELELTTFSSEKYYDGEPLSDARVEYDTLANEGHKIRINGSDGLPAETEQYPSVTEVGEISNAYTVSVLDEKHSNKNCTQNYKITYVYGTLKVKRLSVAVTLKNGETDREKVHYDSTEHVPTLGADGENSEYFDVQPLLQNGEEVNKFTLNYTDFEVVAESRSMRNAGQYYYKVKFNDGSVEERKLYSNYELFVPESGVLEITPLPVAVTLKNYSDTDAFTYSGKAVKLSAADAITDIDLNDGAELPAEVGLEDVISKDDFAVVAADDIIDAGTNYSYTVKIADSVTARNFDVTVSGGKGTVTVNPMPVTVVLSDVLRTYNGEKQTFTVEETVLEIKKTDLKEDEDDETYLNKSDLAVKFTGDDLNLTNVSNYPFEVEAVKKKAKNNYKLSFESSNDNSRKSGLLKINEFELEVTTDTPDFTYNGTNQSSGLFTSGVLANARHTAALKTRTDLLPSVCNVGETRENRIAVDVYDGTDIVTKNYKITYDYGTLAVKPCPISVVTGTTKRAYNGEALQDKSATSDLKLIEDLHHEITVPNNVPSITDKGEIKNVFECGIVDKNGVSVKDNYLITYIYGTLTVTECKVTIATESENKVYDGKPLSKPVAKLSEGAPAGHVAQLAGGMEILTITDAGSIANDFECEILNKDGEVVTDNFDITFEYGTLTVTPLEISIKLYDFSKGSSVDMEYDGNAKLLPVGEAIKEISSDRGLYTLTSSKVGNKVEFSADDFEIVYFSPILDAGSYSYSVKFADEGFAKNFVIKSQTQPTVRVTKKPIEIKLKSFTGTDALTYNAKMQTLDVTQAVTGIFDAENTELDGELLSSADCIVVYPAELLNAGSYKYRVKIEDDFFAKNFLYTEPEANVEIKKVDVEVALKDCSATYSGEKFVFPADAAKVTVNSASETVKALVTPADFTFAADGGESIVDAGTYSYGATLKDGVKARNFNVNTVTDTGYNAVVTIGKLSATVTLNPLTLTFDGGEQSIDGAAAVNSSTPLLTADDFTFAIKRNNAAATLKKAGEYDYEATLTNGNFTLDGGNTVKGGKVTIKKYGVTVTLNNFAKDYDGEEYALLPQTAIFAVDGTMFNALDFKVVYDEAAAGATDHSKFGTYQLKAVLADKHADIVDDVLITCENGEINISKKWVTLTTQTKSFIYDGTEKSAPVPEVSALANGHYAEARADKIVKVKTVTAQPVSNNAEYRIYCNTADGAKVDVTENYEITFNYGTLSVTPRALTVKTGTTRRQYNGSELTDDTYTVDNLAAGHSLIIPDEEDLPSITTVGVIKNEYTVAVMDDMEDVTANYAITYDYGELEVKVIKLKITLQEDVTRPYDGSQITLSGSDVIEALEGDDSLSVDDFAVIFDSRVKNAGDYRFEVALKSEEDAPNYEIRTEGVSLLTVTKLTLDIQLRAHAGVEYGGAAYKATADDIIIGTDALDNPEGISADDFKFDYPEEMKNVGEYYYGVVFKDAGMLVNYELNITGGYVEIVPAQVTVVLKDYVETYNGKSFTIDVSKAILQIKNSSGGDCTVLTKSDFAVTYTDDLLLANQSDDESYSYSVELADAANFNNFVLEIEGGSFRINKRKLTITLSDLYISETDFLMDYYQDYEAEFIVPANNIGLSAFTPLAEGDSLIINSATAVGDGDGKIRLYTLDDFELTNANCYEFTNVNGTDGDTYVEARLQIYKIEW